MKIAIYSDSHLDCTAFQSPPKLEADVVVLAGDIHCPGRLALPWTRQAFAFGDRTLVRVTGNREFYGTTLSSEREAMREAAEPPGAHFCKCAMTAATSGPD